MVLGKFFFSDFAQTFRNYYICITKPKNERKNFRSVTVLEYCIWTTWYCISSLSEKRLTCNIPNCSPVNFRKHFVSQKNLFSVKKMWKIWKTEINFSFSLKFQNFSTMGATKPIFSDSTQKNTSFMIYGVPYRQNFFLLHRCKPFLVGTISRMGCCISIARQNTYMMFTIKQ